MICINSSHFVRQGMSWLRQSFTSLLLSRTVFHPTQSMCECGGQSGIATGVPQRTSLFLCKYHTSNAPLLYFIYLPLTLHKLSN